MPKGVRLCNRLPARPFACGAGPLVMGRRAVHETRASGLARSRSTASRDFALSICLVA
jgi:hypothetical protein